MSSESPIQPDPYELGGTLRDYFAGQALSTVLANEQVPYDQKRSAYLAYEIADAMLAERASRKDDGCDRDRPPGAG